jgi:hypothetical protein
MSHEKEMSAVEWFNDEILIHLNFDQRLYLKDIFNQAKEMQKKQHANTWDDSRVEDKGDNYIGKQKSFNDYYNETYGGNK